ncbi:TPA: AtpZ/AtpI family protein [Campylobacter jejuni]|nr:AtpZ/AtpI family protein [Campylobacter jejuni]HDZ5083776.1 AtpZ/AtpI family protein [Campylobacter jejuni]HDZ5084870.1 AtpZ/AtpI family protein [Campylobacter jejuni]HDZ5086461.1 AtpZ/AtpI family protein [Campylobacter jejuni]HDZ5089639.1 AtpZ/AtpI family protein [Campylobacter jejuni]
MSNISKEENHSKESSNKRQKIIRETLEAANGLSLGISMVVAVFIGVGIGYLLKKFTPYPWLFWLGVFWGISAAILNVYKAYKIQVKSYEEFRERDELIKEKIQKEKNK